MTNDQMILNIKADNDFADTLEWDTVQEIAGHLAETRVQALRAKSDSGELKSEDGECFFGHVQDGQAVHRIVDWHLNAGIDGLIFMAENPDLDVVLS